MWVLDEGVEILCYTKSLKLHPHVPPVYIEQIQSKWSQRSPFRI
jgi:hypothetical protein